MRESEAIFNDDDRQLAIPLNKLFPAHIVKANVRESGTRFIYNPTFRIAEEAESIENIPAYVYENNENGEKVKKPVMEITADGKEKQKIVNGKFMVDREYKYQKAGSTFGGFSFIDEDLERKDRWKNQEYVDILESLQIEFNTNKSGARLLFIMEEDDFLGLPCYVRLGRVSIPRRAKNESGVYIDTGETIEITKAIEILPWETGKKMSAKRLEELYPQDPLDDDEVPF